MEKFRYELVSGVDEGFLTKLAGAVQEARGDLSQREFAEILKVSQSTVQQWEGGKNVPSLENLEKIARLKGMLVEDFVAFLYGRTGGLTSKDILDRVEVMPSRDFAQVLRVMADRMDTARDAPPIVERRGRGSKGVRGGEEGEQVPLELPERVEESEEVNGETGGEEGVRRDAIFYQIFQRFPGLLFEFVEHPPTEAGRYRFESVEVKEPNFRIDGVFLPPDDATSKTVFFAEVQFQKDEDLYYRFLAESMLYLYRNRATYDDWYGVIIFPSRNLEPENWRVHRSLLGGDQIRRVYLDELGDPGQQSVGVGLMQLTIAPEERAVEQARELLERVRAEEGIDRGAIIDVITTIAVYKFTNLSREEVEAMLGLQLEDSRILREAKAEGREEGRQEKALAIALRLLTRRVGVLDEEMRSQVERLSSAQLEDLSEAVLDFAGLEDVVTWLEAQPGQEE